MGSVTPLLSFLLMVVSGWVHRRQLLVIELLIRAPAAVTANDGTIYRRARLGGTLNFYCRKAA
jgi:hypothetical protein